VTSCKPLVCVPVDTLLALSVPVAVGSLTWLWISAVGCLIGFLQFLCCFLGSIVKNTPAFNARLQSTMESNVFRIHPMLRGHCPAWLANVGKRM
jgi:hypothetical protein